MTPPGAAKCGTARGTVWRVRPGSEAEALGIRPGDVIVSINGHVIRDVIDYQFYGVDDAAEMVLERDGINYSVHLEGGGTPGIEFAEASFDGIRRCANRCMFCFVDQLPQSLRQSLYVKDDDYRYSVIYGNFVTLTNMKDDDWRRIVEQHISPLHVSVHCTDLAVRRRLLGNPKAPEVLPQLERLARSGIEIHAQVVLCPGFNDGPILQKTVKDLANLYPRVRSIGVVPVAVSSPRKPWMVGLRGATTEEAANVVNDVRGLQRECRQRLGRGFVYLADEFYLLAGEPMPAATRYDGFPQYENGIGMVRSLTDNWSRLRRRLIEKPVHGPSKITVVCGRLIEPVLREIVNNLAALISSEIELVPVTNRLFGANVTVSGLLSGKDVIETLQGRDLGKCIVLPRSMLDSGGERFLDDVTVAEMEANLGMPVSFAHNVKELLDASLRQSMR